MKTKFYVYGLYGVDGELLYIGKGTSNRCYSHLRGASSNRFVKDIANWVKPKMSDKRLKLEVVFNYPDKRVRDLDNNLKPLIYGLVKCGLCVDDEQFDELIIKRGEAIEGRLIKIKVSEIWWI